MSKTASATLANADWFTSSYSNDQGGNCVETARLDSAMAVRDSKNTAGPAFTVPAAAWTSFLTTLHTPDNS